MGDPKKVDTVTELIPERLVSIHQIRSVFARCQRWKDLLQEVRTLVECNKPENLAPRWLQVVETTEQTEEKNEEGFVMGLLRDLQLERYAKSFREQEIFDIDTFKKLDEGKFTSLGV